MTTTRNLRKFSRIALADTCEHDAIDCLPKMLSCLTTMLYNKYNDVIKSEGDAINNPFQIAPNATL